MTTESKGLWRSCNSSPRGDGNSSLEKPALSIVSSCNSSPRGDGNGLPNRHGYNLCQLQFIPARGRKPRRAAEHRLILHVAIHPREGTETLRTLRPVLLRQCGCNSSPRGDGNLHQSYLFAMKGTRLQFIPARGRKPVSPYHVFPRLVVAIYPREGTET